MTSALIKGDTAHVEMGRASRRQPEGSNFPTPARQHAPSYRSKHVDDTKHVAQNEAIQQGIGTVRLRRRWVVVVARIRREGITAVMRDRCGGPCLTDDAIVYLEAVLPQMAIACDERAFDFNLREWVKLNAPRIPETEVVEAKARILPNPPRYTSIEIGRQLNITADEVQRLGLTHIRPVGWKKRKHQAEQQAKKAAALRLRRLNSGKTVTPRALAILAVEPWTLPGAPCRSRSAFYRLPKQAQDEWSSRARGAGR